MKKLLVWFLTIALVMSMTPAMAFAAGPAESASLMVGSGTLYNPSVPGSTTEVDGAVYNAETNTLTLTDYKPPATSGSAINAYDMGEDFTIVLVGENVVSSIIINNSTSGDCGLRFAGDGSLTVGDGSGNLLGAILVNAGNKKATVTVDNSVTLTAVGSTGTTEKAGIYIDDTSSLREDDPIRIKGTLEEGNRRALFRQENVNLQIDGGWTSLVIYSKDGIWYGREDYQNDQGAYCFRLYVLEKQDGSYVLASPIQKTDLGTDLPDNLGYSPAYVPPGDWFVSSASGTVRIVPGESSEFPVIHTASLPQGFVDEDYSVQLEAFPGSGGTLSWRVADGSLPDGFGLSEGGLLSGTPTSAGTYSFTVEVLETPGSLATMKNYTLSILEPASARVVLSRAPDGSVQWKSGYSCFLTLSAAMMEENISGVMNYTDTNGEEKALNLPAFEKGASTASLKSVLPEDAARINSFVFYAGDMEIPYEIDKPITPVLEVTFSNASCPWPQGEEPLLQITNEQGEMVFSRILSWEGGEIPDILLTNLPEGEYQISCSDWISGVTEEVVYLTDTPAVLMSGKLTKELGLTAHTVTKITPAVKDSSGNTYDWPGICWYSDLQGTNPISQRKSFSRLDQDLLYVQAFPSSYDSPYYDPSGIFEVAAGTDAITLILKKKPTVTVSGKLTAQKADRTGYEPARGSISATLPGVSGYSSGAYAQAGYETGNYELEGVTEGSVITASSWDYIHEDASYTVTAEDIESGTLTHDFELPLVKGQIYFSDITLEDANNGRETVDHVTELRWFTELTVTKADGTVLQAYPAGQSLILMDPSQVRDGEELTITGRHDSYLGLQDYIGTTKVTLRGEDLAGAADSWTLERQGHLMVDYTRPGPVPYAKLIYDQNGKLVLSDLSAIRNEPYAKDSLYGPYLPAGSYTAVMVVQPYLADLAKTDYTTLSALQAKVGSAHRIQKGFAIQDGYETRIDMMLDAQAGSGQMNAEASSVTMSRQYPGTVTIDVTAAPAGSFSRQENEAVTLVIATNQDNQKIGDGYVSTQALSLNGKILPINRYTDGSDSNTGGIIHSDGRIVLTLSAKQLNDYGGFPLRLSTTVDQTDTQALEAEAWISYYDGGTRVTDAIGSYSEQTGGITIESPARTADGSFTVWGEGPASSKNKTYLVNVYANGKKVAETSMDANGLYRAKLNLKTEKWSDGDQILFTARGKYSDGDNLYPYSSKASVTLYDSHGAALTKVVLVYEYSKGGEQKSVTVWDDGDPVSAGKSWYRGGNAGDEGGVYWQLTFDNPEQLNAAYAVVPRNGETVVLKAAKSGGTFRTPMKFFPGSSPDSAYVTYDTKAPVMTLEDAEEITTEDFASSLEKLEETGIIQNAQGTQDHLTFSILNAKGEAISAAYDYYTDIWDSEELADLNALSADYPTCPNIVHYEEGYLTVTDGYWGTDNIYRFENPDVFVRETYTMSSRTITVWDVAKQKKTHSVLTLGEGGVQPDVPEGGIDPEDEINFAMTDQVQLVWWVFNERLGTAVLQASGKTLKDAGLNGSLIQLMGSLPIGKIKNGAEAVARDSYTWVEGEEITLSQIRRIKTFLEQNPCLTEAYNGYKGSNNNPYRVVNEVNSTFALKNMGFLAKLVMVAPKGAGEAAKALAEGAKDYAVNKAKGKVFQRQAEQLAQELFLAAQRATNDPSVDSPCRDSGINLDDFPKDLFPYDEIYGGNVIQRMKNPKGRYDPSGYVYEAVPSNRVEGATVTLYHLEGGTDTETGTTGGSMVQTDTEAFGWEENPQTTGEDGRYEWFVTEGWWRVKAAKEGYVTADTGDSADYGTDAALNSTENKYYMPVLPVQLDVNIPLVSYEAPEVKEDEILATTEGVLVSFTKYMEETALKAAGNILLLVNGNETGFEISLADSEASSDAEDAPSYTRTLLLTPSEAVDTADKVRVVISTAVKSYAGVPLAERFDSGELSVAEPEPASTPQISPEAGHVEKNTYVTLTAQKGETIRYTTDGSEPTEDSPVYTGPILIDGNTTIKAKAFAPGRAPGETLTAAYTAGAPQAAKAFVNGKRVYGGETVEEGKLTLTTETPGAQIWYTTNGICPRDDLENRILYTGPITLKPGEYYFRIRAFKDGEYSEGLPLRLVVTEKDDSGTDPSGGGGGGGGTLPDDPVIPDDPGDDTCKQDETCPIHKFNDSDPKAWYHDGVHWVLEEGIMNGTGESTFAPNSPTTRGMIVTMLWRMEGEPKAESSSFTDLTQDWYIPAVNWAAAKGIVNGYSESSFGPEDPITREQLAAILYRYEAAESGQPIDSKYTDAGQISDWAVDAMAWANTEGIITGRTETTLAPKENATRAEVATMLMRLKTGDGK